MSSFRMSAELFRNQLHGVCVDSHSRIPVPSPAPGTFRRCQSLRLRGERTSPDARPERCCPPPHSASSGRLHALQRSTGRNTDADITRRERSLSLSLVSGSGRGVSRSHSGGVNGTSVPSGGGALTGDVGARRGDTPVTPPTSPDARAYPDDDLDSLRSYTSQASTASCDHPYVAHNGTTFSGRKMRYVVHCTSHAGQTGDEYLTPTQRAQRQIKRLKFMLHQAKQDIEQKDSDIFRLTKELVELRVYKTLQSPEDKSNSSEAVTVRENATDDMKTPDSPTCTDFTDDAKTPFEKSVVDMQSSFADSGHFEDLHTSKDSVAMCDKAVLARLEPEEERRLVEVYERRLEDLMRQHAGETHELKQKHNDKVEELLQRLSDVNLRYCQLVPNYEQAKEKIQELEKQLDEVHKQLQEQEGKNKQLYLQMYNKGMEAAKLEQQEQVMAIAQQHPSRVSVSELLQQLQVTQNELENIKDTEFMAEHSPQAQSLLSAKEAVSLWVLGARKAMYRRLVEVKNSKSEIDPEITLQFLKSAIYYFLTDKENHHGHLRAIQSILGFSPSEISNIDKARTS